jgi:hypothetical protein
MHIQQVNIVHRPRMMKRSQNKTSILVDFVYPKVWYNKIKASRILVNMVVLMYHPF